MKIAIIEVCEPNHYTAVEALALTYGTSINNEIVVFATKLVAQHFGFKHANIEVQIVDEHFIGESLNRINSSNFDRIHINTISKFYKEFADVNWQTEIVFTVHNLEIWFDNSFKKRFGLLFEKILKKNTHQYQLKEDLYLPIKYFFKEIHYQKLRNRFLENLKTIHHKYLVYAENQKNYLKKLAIKSEVLVFPFCIHQPTKDLSEKNTKLRICIPGSVDNQRRDYSHLFELLAQHIDLFKSKMLLDLLGYIPKSNQYLIVEIDKLKKLGLEIIYNGDFIDEITYQIRLNTCDVILGNLKVNLNSQSKYGETKETGVIFNMIKAAKPGIFPLNYSIPSDLSPICKTYTDNLELVLNNLIENKEELNALKNKAKKLAKHYEPKNLYSILIS